jgi:hypothetical protein
MTSLLVPNNQRFRDGVDERLARVRRRSSQGITDAERVELLMEFAASTDREILGEVVKIEYGMARHVLRTQSLVLLYAKSLIALVCTATAVFTAAAVVTSGQAANDRQLVELCTVFAWWAPATLYALSAPLRWLERLLKHESAESTLIKHDRELTRFENIAVRIAVLGWLGAAVGATWARTRRSAPRSCWRAAPRSSRVSTCGTGRARGAASCAATAEGSAPPASRKSLALTRRRPVRSKPPENDQREPSRSSGRPNEEGASAMAVRATRPSSPRAR